MNTSLKEKFFFGGGHTVYEIFKIIKLCNFCNLKFQNVFLENVFNICSLHTQEKNLNKSFETV
jgi:hypothetical protein